MRSSVAPKPTVRTLLARPRRRVQIRSLSSVASVPRLNSHTPNGASANPKAAADSTDRPARSTPSALHPWCCRPKRRGPTGSGDRAGPDDHDRFQLQDGGGVEDAGAEGAVEGGLGPAEPGDGPEQHGAGTPDDRPGPPLGPGLQLGCRVPAELAAGQQRSYLEAAGDRAQFGPQGSQAGLERLGPELDPALADHAGRRHHPHDQAAGRLVPGVGVQHRPHPGERSVGQLEQVAAPMDSSEAIPCPTSTVSAASTARRSVAGSHRSGRCSVTSARRTVVADPATWVTASTLAPPVLLSALMTGAIAAGPVRRRSSSPPADRADSVAACPGPSNCGGTPTTRATS